MEPFQIVIVLFALFALSRAFLRWKDKHIRPTEFAFWSALWILVIIVALVPTVSSYLSRFLGINRPVDLLLYAAILSLFYAVFRLYVKIQGIESSITRLVREEAKRRTK
jgi:hypothetical protein